MKPRLHAITPADERDPLQEARAKANAHVDDFLDSLQVALLHRTRAEHYRELLQPGVMELAAQLARSIEATTLSITTIRNRQP